MKKYSKNKLFNIILAVYLWEELILTVNGILFSLSSITSYDIHSCVKSLIPKKEDSLSTLQGHLLICLVKLIISE